MLPVGALIQLQDAVNKVRLVSRVIGWSKNECLMLEQPSRGGQAVQLPQGVVIVGRGMHEGRVWGFKSKIMFQTLQPFRILFLAFPNEIEEISLRKSERVLSKISTVISTRKYDYANIKDHPETPHGIIRNLSVGGCSVACPYKFELNMPLFFSFELPNGEVIENLMGFIRSDTREHKENIYGVQFDERSEMYSNVIEYVKMAAMLVLSTDTID